MARGGAHGQDIHPASSELGSKLQPSFPQLSKNEAASCTNANRRPGRCAISQSWVTLSGLQPLAARSATRTAWVSLLLEHEAASPNHEGRASMSLDRGARGLKAMAYTANHGQGRRR